MALCSVSMTPTATRIPKKLGDSGKLIIWVNSQTMGFNKSTRLTHIWNWVSLGPPERSFEHPFGSYQGELTAHFSCMFSQHVQVTNRTLLAYVGLREMRILRWYHHRIVGFGLCWLMLAYENCWFFLIFTGGESAHEKYHWGRQETADSRGGSSSVFVEKRGKAMDRPALLWRELPFFRDIIRTVYGMNRGIVHGMQWERCHQLGMIFGFGTRQC